MVAGPSFGRKRIKTPMPPGKRVLLARSEKEKRGMVVDAAASPEADTTIDNTQEALTGLVNRSELDTEQGYIYPEAPTEIGVTFEEADTELPGPKKIAFDWREEADTELPEAKPIPFIQSEEPDTKKTVPTQVEVVEDSQEVWIRPPKDEALHANVHVFAQPEGDTQVPAIPVVPQEEHVQSTVEVEEFDTGEVLLGEMETGKPNRRAVAEMPPTVVHENEQVESTNRLTRALESVATSTLSRIQALGSGLWRHRKSIAFITGVVIAAASLDRMTNNDSTPVNNDASELQVDDIEQEVQAIELDENNAVDDAVEILSTPREILQARAFDGDYTEFVESMDTSAFNMHAVPEQVKASIESNPGSWGVSNEAKPDEMEQVVHLAQARVVEAITFIAGEDIIAFPPGMQDEETHNAWVYFDDEKQERALQTWLVVNAERVTDPMATNVVNVEEFIQKHEQLGSKGVGAIALAAAVERQMPWGFTKFNSGYRSKRDQVITIARMAAKAGIDTTDLSTEEVRQILVNEHGKNVAAVGSSRHHHGTAVDLSLIYTQDQGYRSLFREALSGYANEVVDREMEVAKVKIEPNNGWSGVLHFEYESDAVADALPVDTGF